MAFDTTGQALVWIAVFVAIWFFLIKKDDKGKNYGFLGAMLLVVNALAGFGISDEPITWLIFTVALINFFKQMKSYKIFKLAGP